MMTRIGALVLLLVACIPIVAQDEQCPVGYARYWLADPECQPETPFLINDPCFGTGTMRIATDHPQLKCTWFLDEHRVLDVQLTPNSKGPIPGIIKWSRPPAKRSCGLAKDHYLAINACQGRLMLKKKGERQN